MSMGVVSEPAPSSVLSAIRNRPRLKATMKKYLEAIGYDTTDWVRVAMYRHAFEFITQLGPERLRVMEVSAGSQWRSKFAFQSFVGTSYPAFDICKDVLPEQFDLVIADQIFEHLQWPARAARNVYAMVRPGGHFLIATPFLVRYHPSPIDCNRWTPEGLRNEPDVPVMVWAYARKPLEPAKEEASRTVTERMMGVPFGPNSEARLETDPAGHTMRVAE
jgi:SAM-dependent methyltransferase